MVLEAINVVSAVCCFFYYFKLHFSHFQVYYLKKNFSLGRQLLWKIAVWIKDKIVYSAPSKNIPAETAVEIVKLHEWRVLNL